MDIPLHMLNILLLFFSSFPLGLSVRHDFVFPPTVSTGSKCYYCYLQSGKSDPGITRFTRESSMRTSSLQLLALQAMSAPSLLCEMHGNGINISAQMGCRDWGMLREGGEGNPSPVCRTEMLCRGSHLQVLGSALQKSEGKFHNETKARSICGFNFEINFNFKTQLSCSSVWYLANWSTLELGIRGYFFLA